MPNLAPFTKPSEMKFLLPLLLLLVAACESPPPPVTAATPVLGPDQPQAYFRSDSAFYSFQVPQNNFYDLIGLVYRPEVSAGRSHLQTLYFKTAPDAYVDYFGDSTGLLLPYPLALDREIRADEAGRTVVLRPVAPAVPLNYLSLTDSARYDAAEAASPTFEYSVDVPQGASDDPALNELINADMRDHVLGENASYAGQDDAGRVRSLFKAERDSFFQQELPEDYLSFGPSYSRSTQENGFVRYNADNLLTLEIITATYAGGAHGMYYSNYYNYRVDPPKRLTLLDYVPATKHDELSRVLTDIANTPDTEGVRLSERFYESTDPVPVPDAYNVGVFPDGLLFYFAPYELGPYAAGSFDIFVPMDRLPK